MPSNYSLKFTPQANADLFDIFEYITNQLDAPVSAVKLIDKIENDCNRLRQFPLSGALPKDDTLIKKGYRIVVVDNFIVFYIVDGTTVKIMRVIYGRRNYEHLL